MSHYAIRNKQTNRFLVVDAEAEQGWEYGLDESVPVINKFLELSDSQFPGVVFTTNCPHLLQKLLKEGNSSYPKIRIDFGWGHAKFNIADLEAVELSFPVAKVES